MWDRRMAASIHAMSDACPWREASESADRKSSSSPHACRRAPDRCQIDLAPVQSSETTAAKRRVAFQRCTNDMKRIVADARHRAAQHSGFEAYGWSCRQDAPWVIAGCAAAKRLRVIWRNAASS